MSLQSPASLLAEPCSKHCFYKPLVPHSHFFKLLQGGLKSTGNTYHHSVSAPCENRGSTRFSFSCRSLRDLPGKPAVSGRMSWRTSKRSLSKAPEHGRLVYLRHVVVCCARRQRWTQKWFWDVQRVCHVRYDTARLPVSSQFNSKAIRTS